MNKVMAVMNNFTRDLLCVKAMPLGVTIILLSVYQISDGKGYIHNAVQSHMMADHFKNSTLRDMVETNTSHHPGSWYSNYFSWAGLNWLHRVGLSRFFFPSTTS